MAQEAQREEPRRRLAAPMAAREGLATRPDQEAGGSQSSSSLRGRLAGKYLTFRLGEEWYGVDILRVQEIIQMVRITRVPRTPDFVKGVINLRGKVISVLDLRLVLHMQETPLTSTACIVIVQVLRSGTATTLGLIVDEVLEVVDIAPSQIEPVPEFGSALDVQSVSALTKVGERVMMLLDVDATLDGDQLETVGTLAGEAERT